MVSDPSIHDTSLIGKPLDQPTACAVSEEKRAEIAELIDFIYWCQTPYCEKIYPDDWTIANVDGVDCVIIACCEPADKNKPCLIIQDVQGWLDDNYRLHAADADEVPSSSSELKKIMKETEEWEQQAKERAQQVCRKNLTGAKS